MDRYSKRDVLPGYTGHIPKKLGTLGLTMGQINHILVKKDAGDPNEHDAHKFLFSGKRKVEVARDQEELKYSPRSKHGITWIGGSTDKTAPQHVPGNLVLETIAGYKGYIPKVHAENMFGQPYARLTTQAILTSTASCVRAPTLNTYTSSYKAIHDPPRTSHDRTLTYS